MAERVGQQLGNYRLVRLLGQGGFADVYLGEHIHLGSEAAIKVLHSQLTDDDVDKFRMEARNLVRLIHPHIVRVLDFGIQERTPFLVMDYAPNGTLRQRHPKGAPLPLATVVSYVRQIADALQFAHDEKLIHRDIKPENMLLGRRHEILLSDFGIAIVAQSSRYQSTQDMAGTIAYMAPEQIQAHPRPASDQYSLGIVVYEWLSGERPFHGSFTEIAVKHSVTLPPPLREHVPNLPLDVERVVLTALEKDPHQRFLTVQAFANALANAGGQQQSLPPTVQVAPSGPLPQQIEQRIVLPPTVQVAPSEPLRQQYAPVVPQKTKEHWLEEGNTHYRTGQFQEAIADYSRAIELDPKNTPAYNYRGNAYYNLMDYPKAIADYSRAIALDSRYVSAYYNRGSAFYDMKEYQKALADYNRSVALTPEDAITYNNRGNVYYQLQEYQKALTDYNRSIELDPTYVKAYNNRGNTYSILREYQKALADYERVLELNPNHANAKGSRNKASRMLKKR